MSGNAAIEGNEAFYGGGIFLSEYNGVIDMQNGTISGNKAISTATTQAHGGGIYLSSGRFTKGSSGVIYGSDEGDQSKQNRVLNASNADITNHGAVVSKAGYSRVELTLTGAIDSDVATGWTSP
jgi:hypothetical protein